MKHLHNPARDAEDVANALKHIQEPDEAWKLSVLITERLMGLRGVEVIPDRLYHQIAEVVAEFYALGYVRGVEDR